MYNYAAIKDMAKEQGIRVKDLCVLSPANDPFYTGRPAELKAAQWFASLWERFGYTTGIHLRRVHYQVVSQDPPVMRPDSGRPYQNTERDWAYLMSASKYARYLRLVEPDAFVDRRNPEAKIFAHWDDSDWNDPRPRYGLEDYGSDPWDAYRLPELPELRGIGGGLPSIPGFVVGGYDEIQQDYHVEVWVEKTTMDDVLVPLCRGYRVNLVTFAGEPSMTAVVNFMRRVRDAKRPARILYVSDYDPAGLGMPINVARKIEFFQRENGGDVDIRLQPVVLTAGQVAKYDLPRVPVKDTELRKAAWERDHGQGQVELDALEALHPGDLRDIVMGAILAYYDPELWRKARVQKRALTDALDDIRRGVLDYYADDRSELESDYETLGHDFQEIRDSFAELVADFQQRIDAYQERMGDIRTRGRELYEAIYEGLSDVSVDTDYYPLPDPDLPQESDGMLYASERDYLDQLKAYESYKRGGHARGAET